MILIKHTSFKNSCQLAIVEHVFEANTQLYSTIYSGSLPVVTSFHKVK